MYSFIFHFVFAIFAFFIIIYWYLIQNRIWHIRNNILPLVTLNKVLLPKQKSLLVRSISSLEKELCLTYNTKIILNIKQIFQKENFISKENHCVNSIEISISENFIPLIDLIYKRESSVGNKIFCMVETGILSSKINYEEGLLTLSAKEFALVLEKEKFSKVELFYKPNMLYVENKDNRFLSGQWEVYFER